MRCFFPWCAWVWKAILSLSGWKQRRAEVAPGPLCPSLGRWGRLCLLTMVTARLDWVSWPTSSKPWVLCVKTAMSFWVRCRNGARIAIILMMATFTYLAAFPFEFVPPLGASLFHRPYGGYAGVQHPGLAGFAKDMLAVAPVFVRISAVAFLFPSRSGLDLRAQTALPHRC
jgi:hypothetical protein